MIEIEPLVCYTWVAFKCGMYTG